MTVVQPEAWVKRRMASPSPTVISVAVGQPFELFPKDRVTTGKQGEARIEWPDRSIGRLGPESDTEVGPLPAIGVRAWLLELLQGKFFYFRRGDPEDINIRTPCLRAAMKGTELVVEHTEAASKISLWDGRLEVTAGGRTELLNAEEGIRVDAGGQMRKVGLLVANRVQWWLPYPAILDLDDLTWEGPEAEATADSRARWRVGDMLGALAAMPVGIEFRSEAGRVYEAAVALLAGRVEVAESYLEIVQNSVADGMRELIAAVRREEGEIREEPTTTTGWLGRSYRLQERLDVRGALVAAVHATELGASCGLAWHRRAELEFSMGDSRASSESLRRALEQTPRLPAAHALRGFVLASEGRMNEAREVFRVALGGDGGLSDA